MQTLTPMMTPGDPAHAALQALCDMVKVFADPAAFQQRMEQLTTAETSARAAIEQASKDTAGASKAKRDAEDDIAKRRADFEFQQRHASDEHKARMSTERAELEADRKAARTARSQAEADAAEAQRIRADLQRRLKLITEPSL